MARSPAAIVEQQVGRWRQAQGAASAPGACVALSHLPGAGAVELGRRVAEQLGYGFFDREIVEAITQDSGTQARLVGEVDEHVRSVIDRYLVDFFRGRGFGEDEYLRAVVRVVQTLAHRGGAVLLGRGATAILTPRQALRVLVVAPREVRLERFARERGLERGAAEAQLDRQEADRAEFIRHHFGIRQDDPARYELVVNTGTLSLDLAARLVIDALCGQFPGAAAAAGSLHSGTG